MMMNEYGFSHKLGSTAHAEYQLYRETRVNAFPEQDLPKALRNR